MTGKKQDILDHYAGHWEDFYSQYIQDIQNKGKETTGTCPFCGAETGHFYTSKETGQFLCHKCSEKGDPFTFFGSKKVLVRGDAETIWKRLREDLELEDGIEERKLRRSRT